LTGPKSPKATMADRDGWGLLRDIRGGRDHETGEVVRNDDPNYYTNELMQVEVPIVGEALCQLTFPASPSIIE